MMNHKLDNIVDHRVSMLAVFFKRQIFKILADNNLSITPDQWNVLYYLWEENGLSVGEIALRSKKDFANVTRIVDKLVKLEYVTKKKSSTDSRSTLVYTLPKGETIRSEVEKCWLEASKTTLKGITKTEQKQFMDTLAKIEKNVLTFLEKE